MSLINIVSKVEAEIRYLNELLETIQIRYNKRILSLKERFEADVKRETEELEAVQKELNATLKQLKHLIDEPTSNVVPLENKVANG